ncbi:hypothetical protein V8E54_011939 [Elaphomyces granulatus]
MPGLEIANRSAYPPELGRPLLRAHKALPRRRDIIDNLPPIRIPLSRPAIDQPNGTTTVVSAPVLPLTPPGQVLKSFEDDPTDSPKLPMRPPERYAPEGTARLHHQFSPPTPEITPPRASSCAQKSWVNIPLQPPISSRTESFKTAREAFSSDEELDGSCRSTQSLQQNSQPRRKRSPPRNGIRSGPEVGPLEKEREARSKSRRGMRQLSGFDTFDGEWTGNHQGGSPTPASSQGGDGPSEQGRRERGFDASDVGGTSLKTSLKRGKSLRERVKESQEAPVSPSVERFGEDIAWHLVEENWHTSELGNVWRMSGESTTSMIEAMVIDSPPRRRRTLRHTEKRLSLRSASSPVPQSTGPSLASSHGSQHRLTHKTARISNENRQSVVSEISLATGVMHNPSQQRPEVIPVVVIPRRRSSLKSSTPSSRNQSLTRSQGSNRRPTTAPSQTRGSVDTRPKDRAVSESMRPSRTVDREIRAHGSGRPHVPPRSSSLSAPTSRNNSRTNSLTSESLRQHTEAMKTGVRNHHGGQPDLQPSAPKVSPHLRQSMNEPDHLSIQRGSDFYYRSPTSAHFNHSIVSSSPGPVEISEATAVSLFAHNNRSLLLVDQNAQFESRVAPTGRNRPLETPRDAGTPAGSSTCLPNDVDSPLRNPRPPPEPPMLKVIPPTPMDEDRQRSAPPKNDQEGSPNLIRRLSSVRRALGAGRRSESFPSFTWSFATRTARDRKAGKDIDRRLYPFRRPRGFWADFPDSDDERWFDGDIPAQHDGHGNGIVNNSLGLSPERTIFSSPSSSNRSINDLRRGLRGFGNGAYRPRSPYGRVRFLPRFGLRLRFIRPRVLKERLRLLRQQRKDEKREARRMELKGSIGFPVNPDSAGYHAFDRRTS